MVPNQAGPATPRSPFDNGGGPTLLGGAGAPEMPSPLACFGSMPGNIDSSSIPSTGTNVDLGSLQVRQGMLYSCPYLRC